MNWTEGALHRNSHRKGWNADTARQKQYFAKARSGLKHRPPSDSPHRKALFVPSYITEDRASHGIGHGPNSTSLRTKLRSSSLSTRKGLAHLSSDSATLTSRDDDQISDNRLSVELGLDSSQKHDVAVRYNSVSLEAKRRRLLEKNDWSGIEFQRPLLLQYPSGDRSKEQTSRGARNKARSHLLGGTGLPNPVDYRKGRFSKNEALSEETSLRLRIGSQSLR